MKKKDHIEVLGLMSGTSLDGLDMALCRFPGTLDGFELLSAETRKYPDQLHKRLERVTELPSEQLLVLDAELGAWMGEMASDFIASQRSGPEIIASHGHTVFHQPEKGITVQIGNPAYIKAASNIRVISDFRSLDVALGGQGAPLVPVGDQLLFGNYTYCLNLGGIANISFNDRNNRIAYDICACNMVLNHLANREGYDYDRNGEMAMRGRLIDSLLSRLRNWGFLKSQPPKSLGYERIAAELFPLLSENESTPDLLHTFCHHIAEAIADSCQKGGNMLITGGGAHNAFLRELIREKCSVDLIYPESDIVDFKEAIVFAFLGALHHFGRINVLSSVTGARCDHIGGVVTG